MEDAITARKDLNGYEILGGEAGPVRIGFAKVPSRLPPNFDPATGFDPALESYHSNLTMGLVAGTVVDPFGLSNGGLAIELDQIQTILASTSETQLLMRELSLDDPQSDAHTAAVGGES